MIRLCVLALFLVVAPAVAAETVIHGIRTGENASSTRVVIDLKAKPVWNLFVLANPYRIVVDIENAEWDLKARPDPPRGLVTSLRYGRFATDTGRIVLESAEAAVAAKQFVLPPQAGHGYRLVLDLRPASDSQFAAAKAATVPTVRLNRPVDGVAGVPPAPPSRRQRIRTVVIDPGHGGADPGALGRGRTREKDIVLAVGLVLRRALQDRGQYRVVMTRASDRFIPWGKGPDCTAGGTQNFSFRCMRIPRLDAPSGGPVSTRCQKRRRTRKRRLWRDVRTSRTSLPAWTSVRMRTKSPT